MKITALAPWYGSDRMIGEHIGRLLKGCAWVGIPFAGGMAALAHIDARTMAVNDLHRSVINLGMTVADPLLKDQLVGLVDDLLFHPDCLALSQLRCRARETVMPAPITEPSLHWAADYFICAWMSRNGTAGTTNEFETGLSFRWEAGGGDSATRLRNATASLHEWHKIARRCTFTTDDAFNFLADCLKRDRPGHGLYVDPPFPGPGDGYKFNAGDTADAQRKWHVRLFDSLASFRATRVVARFYDHPLIRELYRESDWTWNRIKGRKQTNDEAPEVLIVNRAKE